MWLPVFKFKELTDRELLSEQVLLKADGTVLFKRDSVITLNCNLDFSNMPKDRHMCPIIVFLDQWNTE